MKENVGESGVWAVCYFDCKQASSSRYFVFGPGVCKRIGDFNVENKRTCART